MAQQSQNKFIVYTEDKKLHFLRFEGDTIKEYCTAPSGLKFNSFSRFIRNHPNRSIMEMEGQHFDVWRGL